MTKITNNFLISILSIFIFSLGFAQQETLTITTYYPSPYGSYRQLTADQIAIGSGYRNPTYADGSLYVQGNVGIGTTSPNRKLVVQGTGTGTGGAVNYEGMRLRHTGAGGGSWDILACANNSVSPGGITIWDDTVNQHRFVITGTGNVGIGTTAPQARLHISGGRFRITDGVEEAQPNEIWATASIINYSVRGWHRFVINSDNAVNPGGDNFDVYNVNTSGTPLFRVNSSGNVGIGTTAPTQALDVNGNAAANDVWLKNVGRWASQSGGGFESNCRWLCGGYGTFLRCPANYVVKGACGSGKDADCSGGPCGDGTWHAILCCSN